MIGGEQLCKNHERKLYSALLKMDVAISVLTYQQPLVSGPDG
jgi:hypothetical protein